MAANRGQLLRDRDVRLIVASVGLSALGDFVAWIALMLAVQSLTGSGLAVGGVLVALFAPIAVLAPIAGVVADRVESRGLLMGVSVAQAAAGVGLALSIGALPGILAFTALLGIGSAFAQPAEFALVPVIARRQPGDRLNEVNGLVETARYAGMAAGPLIGGLLVAAGGTRVALLINAASFLAVALAALRLTVRRRAQAGDLGDGQPDRAREGIVHLFRDRLLGLVIGASFASLLFFTASASAEVFFAKDVLDAGDVGYAVLMTGWMVGMIVGAVLISRGVGPRGLALGALVGIAVQGIGIALPTAWLVFPFAVALYSLGGVAHGTKNVLVRTLIQLRVPDHVHGRAFAAYNGLRNGAEIFPLLVGGALVSAIGSRATLALSGGIPFVVALGALALYRSRRETEPGPEEAVAEALDPAPPVTTEAVL